MISSRRLLVLLVLFMLLSAFGLAHASSLIQAQDSAVDIAGGPQDRVEVVLRADNVPNQGGVATLTFEVTPLDDAPDLLLQWIVPEGVELLGENSESLGPVAAGQTVRSERQVRFTDLGVQRITADASYEPAEGISNGAAGVLFFTVGERFSRVSDIDPLAVSPMGSRMPTTVTTSAILPNGLSSPDGDPCFNISGRLVRIERSPSTGGFGTAVPMPVHNAHIEISEEDILFDDTYAHLYTNNNGQYSYSFCDDDGWFDDELEIYIQLEAELYVNNGGTLVAEVLDISWIDEVYTFDSNVVSSEGGSITIDMNLTENQSAVMNIADAMFDAWTFWNASGGDTDGDKTFDEEGEAHWEPGYGETGSYYTDVHREITIADDASDPDQWDDSVIIHEFGHNADDLYSCDDNPGGPHNIDSNIDVELAWGEGYPDYYQSVVRQSIGQAQSNIYIDMRSTSAALARNLEILGGSTPVTVQNEIAIAAALWDLQDSGTDGQDTVTYGHAAVQEVYTSDEFEDAAYGAIDDDCDFDAYMKAWAEMGKPTDTATAAAVNQNTGYTLQPASPLARSANRPQAVSATPKLDYKWWNQLTYVVDNSSSMAGAKLNAVKTVLAEAVNDLGSLPEGTEFTVETFNQSSASNKTLFAGQFFPERVLPTINSLGTAGGTDSNCKVYGLRALAQGVSEQDGGDAWLFTDGDSYQVPGAADLSQTLNSKGIRGSVAMLGLCPAITTNTMTEEEEQTLTMLKGAAQRSLGLAAAETPGGLVPYLLTAVNSGGQFLFVDPAQVENAADILRAQITHSAGAGKWSDYVSDEPTYRWDRLATWEYEWINAKSGGTDHGSPTASYVTVTMPSFSYFFDGPYSSARAYEDGYITFGTQFGVDENNKVLPNFFLPNNTLYPYWDNLWWIAPPALAGEEETPAAQNGIIYSKQEGAWKVIQYDNFWVGGKPLTFQVLLNIESGEIRYQYDVVPAAGAGGATIGLEDKNGTNSVQVSYNDVNGAKADSGYKFTPAPPQPAKTYEVEVDGLMQGVGFLLTGYSGSFEPLVVRDPGGTAVNCADTANVICLNLGLVQYVQVDVDGRVGKWTATVDAGPTGSGTFTFTSMAAGELSPKSPNDHLISSAATTPILMNLGQPVDGNVIGGWFRGVDGGDMGPHFDLFDDGSHNDGAFGDGLFGSDPQPSPGRGPAYLWVEGNLGGVTFKRHDPVPFQFQPVSIRSLSDGFNEGGATLLEWELRNDDVHDHCYAYTYQAPEGWWMQLPIFFPYVCIDAGKSGVVGHNVYLDSGVTNNQPSGTSGPVSLTITERERGIISDTAVAQVTRVRPPDSVRVSASARILEPGGEKAQLEIIVLDEQQMAVADGTKVTLSGSLVSITDTVGFTQDGVLRTEIASGNAEGTALITAETDNNVQGEIQIDIVEAPANQIALSVDPGSLLADGKSTAELLATVRNRFDEPVTGQKVVIGVSGDGQMGSLNGPSEQVVEGVTDGDGRFAATFVSGLLPGAVRIRAELHVPAGGGTRPAHDAEQLIKLRSGMIYLPIVHKE